MGTRRLQGPFVECGECLSGPKKTLIRGAWRGCFFFDSLILRQIKGQKGGTQFIRKTWRITTKAAAVVIVYCVLSCPTVISCFTIKRMKTRLVYCLKLTMGWIINNNDVDVLITSPIKKKKYIGLQNRWLKVCRVVFLGLLSAPGMRLNQPSFINLLNQMAGQTPWFKSIMNIGLKTTIVNGDICFDCFTRRFFSEQVQMGTHWNINGP